MTTSMSSEAQKNFELTNGKSDLSNKFSVVIKKRERKRKRLLI